MILRDCLRTTDLAQAGQISVQQVRNYEAGGFLPPAERSPSGYRLYTPMHRAALLTVRRLLPGYGWQRTRAIMQAVHAGELGEALAVVDERHAELAGKRTQLEQTLAALGSLAAQSAPRASTRYTRPLRIGEAAKRVGVRVSAVHFWEQQGLLQPQRESSSRYRLYDEQQMRRLRVVVLLREAGYDFDAIRLALHELASGNTHKAIAAVESRRAELAATSRQCLAAMALFDDYISRYQHR